MFGIYFWSLLFVVGGAFHFIKPKVYLRVMPLFFPYRLFLIYLSGVIEIAAGILFYIEATREYGAYLILALLSVFLVVHFNMLRGGKFAAGLPIWLLIVRLIAQFAMMYWILTYTNLMI